MKSIITALARRTARRAGYDLKPMSSKGPPSPVDLDNPAEAIYTHGDPIFLVPLEFCHYPYVFSYSPHGWHPFVETLKEILANRSLRYEDSALYRYYQSFQPANIREALFEPGSDDSGCEELVRYSTREYLPLLPWDPALVPIRGEKGLQGVHGHQGYGPVSREKGQLEFRRLADTLHSIELHGYRPARHPDGDIRGYFLKRGQEYRFLVRSGLHRTAVLSALGHERIRAGFFRNYPRAIHLCEVEHWPLVRKGYFSADAARRYFLRFFEEDGMTKAARLGLTEQ